MTTDGRPDAAPGGPRRVGLPVGSLAALVAVLLGAVLPPADAAWATTSDGSSTARAARLDAPTDVAVGKLTCGVVAASVALSWSPVTQAASYAVDVASNATFTTGLRQSTTSTTSTTYTDSSLLGSRRTVYVRVRAAAGTWTSTDSTTTIATVGPCLL